jgi:hypothetical protein
MREHRMLLLRRLCGRALPVAEDAVRVPTLVHVTVYGWTTPNIELRLRRHAGDMRGRFSLSQSC